MKRMLTGLQPTGIITLGNYIGAIKQMVANQDNYDSFLFIADLHAITVKQDPIKLKENIKSLLALYLACGIDPNKNTIYLQSTIDYIPCISWLLECTVYYGELSRMTQFKDKSAKNANFTAGLLTYPVLMASDILAVDSNIVPVGVDQKQHLEIARDIAERFNKVYGESFIVPEPFISKSGTKIMDLQNPEIKMSKSTENKKGVILLLDEPSAIRKKIMSATTDSDTKIIVAEDKKGITNLINMYSAMTGLTTKEIEDKYIGANYGTFKRDLAEIVVTELTKIQDKYNEYLNSPVLDEILERGKAKVMPIVKEKYEKMKHFMGLEK